MRTEKSIRMFTAEEHRVALLNLAVPSPIFRDTDPILVLLRVRVSLGRFESTSEWTRELLTKIYGGYTH